MITRPFNFEAHLRRPTARLEVVPFINVCLILLFFALLHSRFVVAPGVSLALPTTKAEPMDAVATSRVLTVKEVQGGEMLIFEGRILKLESFEKALAGFTAGAPGEVLLVRADRDVSVQLLVRVCELAERAGFQRVQIAAEPEKAAAPGLP